MPSLAPRRYRFGSFELRHAEGQLLASGEPASLSGRALDLLLALVESGGQLASKAALLEKVWPGLVVEENTLQVHVSTLRKLLGADAIVTVSGRGYRFAPEVVVVDTQTAPASADNLPRPSTSFIGRAKETQDIGRLLDRSRILTIVGVGGCGKTRLAIEAAAERHSAAPDGMWFVDLAALSDAALLAQRVAVQVGAAERPDEAVIDTVLRHLKDKRALLILDNAEHLLTPCAQMIDALLNGCPALSILVTSRERLGVMGELAYRVPSLAVPEAHADASPESLATCESVALFIERARVLRPHFSVTVSNANVLAAICRRLDGIPLAIELAAPRVRFMPLEEILQRLDRRFSLLSDGTNTRIPRQRTLRALIDWSYELMSPSEQAMLCRTSVFLGGWTLAAAEAVCSADDVARADVLDVLAALVDKNLLSMEESHGIPRYRVLETVRQYGLERLKENAEDFRRCMALLLVHITGLAQEAETGMTGPDQAAWFEQLEADHSNIRASLSWALGEGADAVAALRIAGGLWRFWFTRGHVHEGSDWLSRALAAAPADAPAGPLGKVCNGAGAMAVVQTRFDVATAMFEKTLQLRTASGDKVGAAAALSNLATAANATGDSARAEVLYRQSLALSRDLGNAAGVATTLHNLGDVVRDQGRYDDAIALYEECIVTSRRLGKIGVLGSNLLGLAIAFARKGDHTTARRRALQGLDLLWTNKDRWLVSNALCELGMIAELAGIPLRAARFFGAAQTMREQIGAPLREDQQRQQDREVASARAALNDDAAFEQAWQQGRAMNWDDAVRYATDAGDCWPADWREPADAHLARHQETSGIHQK